MMKLVKQCKRKIDQLDLFLLLLFFCSHYNRMYCILSPYLFYFIMSICIMLKLIVRCFLSFFYFFYFVVLTISFILQQFIALFITLMIYIYIY